MRGVIRFGLLHEAEHEQMARLRPSFPKSDGKPRIDDRRVSSGILFVNRNGLRWRDAPKGYRPHKTLYDRWSEMGIFLRIREGMPSGESCRTLHPSRVS